MFFEKNLMFFSPETNPDEPKTPARSHPPQWHRLNKGPQKCAHQKIKKVPQATVYSKKNGCSKKKKGLHLQFGGWNPYLPCFGPEYLMFFVLKFDVTLGVFAGITALYIQSSDIKFVQAESNLRL